MILIDTIRISNFVFGKFILISGDKLIFLHMFNAQIYFERGPFIP